MALSQLCGAATPAQPFYLATASEATATDAAAYATYTEATATSGPFHFWQRRIMHKFYYGLPNNAQCLSFTTGGC